LTATADQIRANAGDIVCVPLLEALLREEQRWDELVAESPVSSPFMSHAWHSAWAKAADAEHARSSFVVALRGSHSIDAVLPLTLRPLRFRGRPVTALTWATRSVGCPDHLDIPATAGAALDTVVPMLEQLRWDVAIFSGVAENAGNLGRVMQEFSTRGHAVRQARLDVCPYLDLPASWDEFLATLSASRRQSVRRRERNIVREHGARLVDYAPERLDEGWAHLQALHEARWHGGGALSDTSERLLRHFFQSLASRGELWLTSLDLNGKPAAAWCGFACGDTVFFYQSGRDPEWESKSVGTVMMGMMIRRAIERGFRRFDFLRGEDSYKMSWTSTRRMIYETVVFRHGVRGSFLRALDEVARRRARRRGRGEHAVADQ
jgi:CelD/BcsL family acetyltransferase involved in cellulose biosynthesis